MVSTDHEQFEAENPDETVRIIGLTGGIASGKSTISTLFHELGVAIIDADIISRQVVAPGKSALSEIVNLFGDEIILPSGKLNREKLGAIIFNDEKYRQNLNSIIHPHVAQQFLDEVKNHKANGEAWVIYDAALIVENNLQSGFDGLIVVKCDPSVQLARLMLRNSLSESEAQDRIQSQFPLEKKVQVADWIIDNSGTLEDSTRQVNSLFKTLCRKFGTPYKEK